MLKKNRRNSEYYITPNLYDWLKDSFGLPPPEPDFEQPNLPYFDSWTT